MRFSIVTYGKAQAQPKRNYYRRMLTEFKHPQNKTTYYADIATMCNFFLDALLLIICIVLQ